jgi:pimeloyl-ACP methyl ester carboxylesterase
VTRRRNRALALSVAGVGAGTAAYRAARKYRAIAAALDLSELALAEDLEPIDVVVDDGSTIHGVEAGTGRPIVLLHGVTLSVATWPFQLKGLCKEYRVIALDARGHGSSTSTARGWGIDRMASDVAQVLTKLDLRDAIVVGHSMGGMMTQQMCLDFPDLSRERIAGTILLSTAAAPGQGVPGFKAINRITRPGALAVAERMQSRAKGILPPAEIGYAIARLALGAKADPRFVTHTQNMSSAFSPQTIGSLLPHVVGFEVRHRLKDYPVPALVVVGSRDLLTPPRIGRDLARRIPGAGFEVVPGAGHMVMLERAEWLNERIDAFARQHAH